METFTPSVHYGLETPYRYSLTASDARTLRRASLRAARTLRSPREGGEWPTVCRSLEAAGREVLGCEHVALLLYDRALHALHGWRGDEELRVDVDPLRDVLESQGRGRVPVHVVPRLEDNREVVLTLNETYAVSPAVIQALKSVQGVLEVVET